MIMTNKTISKTTTNKNVYYKISTYINSLFRAIFLILLIKDFNIFLDYLNVYLQVYNLSNFNYDVDWYNLIYPIIIKGILFLTLTIITLSAIYSSKFIKLSILKGIILKYTINIITVIIMTFAISHARDEFYIILYLLIFTTFIFILNIYFQELYIILSKENSIKKAIQKNIKYNQQLSTKHKTWLHGKITNVKYDVLTIITLFALYFISYTKKHESLIQFHKRTVF